MLRPQRVPELVFGAGALVVSLYYAVVLVRHAGGIGPPLDDSYIYLTYAKQIARGHPFTYFDGGGYSAGATSPLWPFVLAPLWAVGLRGPLFPAAVFALGALLFGATCFLAARIAGRVGGPFASWAAGAFVLTCAPLSWAYLSGMEAALTGLLVLCVCEVLLATDVELPAVPSHVVSLTLSLAALARPELALWCALIAVVAVLRSRRVESLRWALPLAPVLVWMLANRTYAGSFSPNTAISKSHFLLPAFDWRTYASTVVDQTAAMLVGLVRRETSPIHPSWLIAILFLMGSAGVVGFGARRGRTLAATALGSAAPLLFAAVIATSGHWQFQNFRYLAMGLPALLTVAGIGAGAVLARMSDEVGGGRAVHYAGVAALVGVAIAALPRLEASTLLFAQGHRDESAHVVAVAAWMREHLPADARVALHDAGAIGYYGERKLFDVVGLVTNRQAEWCNHGPGARFESLERLAPDALPTHFAYYPGWLLAGARDLYGPSLAAFPLPAPLPGAERAGTRLVGDSLMELMTADLGLLGTGARPLEIRNGWEVVDELDVADLTSERAHDYHADLGRRTFGQTSDPFSCFWRARHTAPSGARDVADGGRTIIGPAGERFRLKIRQGAPTRLLMRVGGPTSIPPSSVHPDAQVVIVSGKDGVTLGRIALPAPSPFFTDLDMVVPTTDATALDLVVRSEGSLPYRVFHYYALQSVNER